MLILQSTLGPRGKCKKVVQQWNVYTYTDDDDLVILLLNLETMGEAVAIIPEIAILPRCMLYVDDAAARLLDFLFIAFYDTQWDETWWYSYTDTPGASLMEVFRLMI